MSRYPRHRVAGLAQHLVQRGNNRAETFRSPADFERYLECLAIASERSRCAVHAYVLMSNHVHLLVTPDEPDGPSEMMQGIGRRFVRYFNDRYARTGTLWEGRFKSVPVDSERYLAACHRYIESNPVRAGLVASPGDYWWSSFRCNAIGDANAIITPHSWFLGLGANDTDRRRAYRALFDTDLDGKAVHEIRHGIPRSRMTGRPWGGKRPRAGRASDVSAVSRGNSTEPDPLVLFK